ncbi:hypothetical protein B0A50_05650 [Salinomyces thailandicus]|uniref:BRCT domain-containing protein n=1 Tax=Salinomyces thailandicus TaxID=706561 RepID=A0A4U0TVN2_9PEZI|nr:hypothetical protein B0A50_05650 [Salinomyces thailandica]
MSSKWNGGWDVPNKNEPPYDTEGSRRVHRRHLVAVDVPVHVDKTSKKRKRDAGDEKMAEVATDESLPPPQHDTTSATEPKTVDTVKSTPRAMSKLFSGLKVHIDWPEGTRKRSVVEGLRQRGGQIHHEPFHDTTLLVTTGSSSRVRLYAKRHNIRMVTIDWLEASLSSDKLAPVNLYDVDRTGQLRTNFNGDSRQAPELEQESVLAWIQNHESQSQTSTPGHASHIFRGLKICVTSGARKERDSICMLVQQHGGVYDWNFADDATHIIAFSRHGQRWDLALARRPALKIVSEQWLKDCVESGERKDETSYDPVNGEERGLDELHSLGSSQNIIVAPPSNQQHAQRLAAETPSRGQKRRRVEELSPSVRQTQRAETSGSVSLPKGATACRRQLCSGAPLTGNADFVVKDSQETVDEEDSIATQSTRMSLPHGGTPGLGRIAAQAAQQSSVTSAVDAGAGRTADRTIASSTEEAVAPAQNGYTRDHKTIPRLQSRPSPDVQVKQTPAQTPTPDDPTMDPTVRTVPLAQLPTPPRSSQTPTTHWTLDNITIPRAKKIYAVRRGHRPGFYWSYDAVLAEVSEVPYNLYRVFKNTAVGQQHALDFLNHSPDGKGKCGFGCSPRCRGVEEEYAVVQRGVGVGGGVGGGGVDGDLETAAKGGPG